MWAHACSISTCELEAEASNSRPSSATQSVQGPVGYTKPCHKKRNRNLISLAAHAGNSRVRRQRQRDHCKFSQPAPHSGVQGQSEVRRYRGWVLEGPGDTACPVPVESEPTLPVLVPMGIAKSSSI